MPRRANDPVLALVAEQDSDLYVRCLHALIDLGAGPGVATESDLPDSVIEALVAHPSPDVRGSLAWNESCPQAVLTALATDPDVGVRRGVAKHPSTPPQALLTLVTDQDEWVRYDAVRNPNCSEEARVAFALASTPSEVQRARGGVDYWTPKPEEDPSTPPEVLREMTEQALAGPGNSEVRSRLGRNPSLPEDLFERLIDAAVYRSEWSSLWNRTTVGWITAVAFIDEEAPEWLVATLTDLGHPLALLRTDLKPSAPTVDGAASVRLMIATEILVRALWRELALLGIVHLVYWNDTVDGDKFFPSIEEVILLDPQGPGQRLLGGFSDEREWIETEDFLDVDDVRNLASQAFSDGWLVDHVEEFTEQDLDLFALAGSAYASGYWEGASVTWTEAGIEALEGDMWEWAAERADSEDYSTKVTVVDSDLPDIGYADTSDSQKAWLTELVRQSRSDPMISRWGIADHFLMCIALHPATPTSLRDQLLMDPSESVRESARLGSERATAS